MAYLIKLFQPKPRMQRTGMRLPLSRKPLGGHVGILEGAVVSLGNVDWNTFWTAVGALATVGAVFAIYQAGRQLRFETWLKAQEIIIDEQFTEARRRIFRHLDESASEWDVGDHRAALLVCRKMDEFCALAPFFAITKAQSRKRVLEAWADPVGKAWGLLEPFVTQERIKTRWPGKWKAFQDLGTPALRLLPEELRARATSAAGRLGPQMSQLLKLQSASLPSGAA